MAPLRILAAMLAVLVAASAHASELRGPGRFCGYSPIIDLVAGERIQTLEGGIHAGTFRWEGPFGSLEVNGIGLASKPRGTEAKGDSSKGHVRFNERLVDGRFQVALWNRAHGAAYFSSNRRLTRAQLAAIDRVDLFNEGEEPAGCKLRTVFSWD